ncbi:uncharacterized protein LODBEIA_P48500 [Lodderomyces beijingensis]|uniref:Elongator complex protein 2 n=1 Tax=Lodderomyces beijingensis TaxID=1775926 RepID=A0ABP0ZU23_9ASCO
MTASETAQEAIFVGANKQNCGSAYNAKNSVVAFAAANTVALWKPLDKNHNGVYYTLKHHTKEVTGVEFLPESPYLVSVGEDHGVHVWKEKKDVYEHHQSLEGHTHSVQCVAVVNPAVFVTGGADHEIIIWVCNDNQKFEMGYKFQVKSNFYPLTLAVQDIDDKGNYILAVGGTTNNVYIYTFQVQYGSVNKFRKSEELTGHEDWVKCLAFVVQEKSEDYILATGSQDRYVRLWRLRLNDKIDNSDEDPTKLTLLANKQFKFEYGDGDKAAFSFEALITGHDDWISGLQWHPSCRNGDGGSGEKQLQLLTATADTALMIWEMDVDSGIWVCVSRLGEMSIKGASTATGASGGFWSCLWFIDHQNSEEWVLATGKTGAVRAYKSGPADEKYFKETLGVTGAVAAVTDLRWSLSGEYFMATSLDQTTRLYAPWTRDRHGVTTWHEFARPQIHGYDMICWDNISSTRFVSGGDEKILRVFELTKSIDETLKKLSGIEINKANSQLPAFASLPVLGLSNKADTQIYEEKKNDGDEEEEDGEDEAAEGEAAEAEVAEEQFNSPPSESYLQRHSLATEVEKLYGHGYEINCCCTSPNGELIATACRSNSEKHAVIRIFKVNDDFQQSPQVLAGHNLTISSLAFSPDGRYLLSVSRDRQFSLWQLANPATAEFKLVKLNTKAHTRIIWDCAWLREENCFVTVSRDKSLKLWRIRDESVVELANSLKLDEPITSVSSFKGKLGGENDILAVGLESGAIAIVAISVTQGSLHSVYSVSSDCTPADRIEKLSFSPKLINDKLYLGVASRDTSVRLYSFHKNMF